ncbi:TetR/AcrR family transcriptional regulator [Herbaspirillum sp. WKF16]|uniref:TetR/AcrR family transcriptional regulator n=1 Tax=Herbaspirillum sp. WKF16 TaxID=3028312 RepID=UPI0023AA1372|nr:TetR/AcrR family transcriptional regulator [Herbaspirillum sp. WKF16]WDZ95823.1 TetR/AcrR family transcriptional regulator [Herbaspirillum sp. WKF16]
MSADADNPIRRRRRGQQLEAELLETAWNELVEAGFSSLTMESVAVRACTGIAVLYRRWPNKDELVCDALKHYRASHPVELPDTGSLRGDLLALLRVMGRERADFFIVMTNAICSGLLARHGLNPTEVRDRVFGDQRQLHIGNIYRRAHDRGEINLKRLSSAVLALPTDLVRHDLLVELKPLAESRIKSIVDDIFLPLVNLKSVR